MGKDVLLSFSSALESQEHQNLRCDISKPNLAPLQKQTTGPIHNLIDLEGQYPKLPNLSDLPTY